MDPANGHSVGLIPNSFCYLHILFSNIRVFSCRMFIHELIAAPSQTDRLLMARKIVKLLAKSIKEQNYALAAICCSVLTCSEGPPPPLEFSEPDGKGIRKLLPVLSNFMHAPTAKAVALILLFDLASQAPAHMPLTGLTSRVPAMRELVWSHMAGKFGYL
jgi:hypothetical protein